MGPGASMARLPGWNAEDHAGAYAAIRQACGESPAFGETRTCIDAKAAGVLDEIAAKAYLERHFRAEAVAGEGILTAYFAPAYEARRFSEGDFTAPLRPAAADPAGAGDRSEIERGPATDALAWLRPEDLFLLQVQGSGVLDFPDGGRIRAAYAASNARPFTPIARTLIARGLIAVSDASADAVHDWLASHRGPEATAVMDEDARYIFFRLEPDDGGEPRGAAGVAMIPGRSVAIDPAQHAYFEPLWIDGEAPTLSGARPVYQRLAVTLDTGGAIQGRVRADLYLGSGARAGEEASRVRHRLKLYRITPATP